LAFFTGRKQRRDTRRRPAQGFSLVIRAALVGLGWWGNALATAAQQVADRLAIVACCSRSADETRAFAERIGARPIANYEAALGRADIDAVMLATPHSQHAAQTIAAASARKHVFVEKPFTLSTASAREAAAACAASGVVLAVGHNRRFSAGATMIKKLFEEGALGTVLHVEGHFSSNSAMRYPADGWRALRAEAPGGAIASIGLHLIDVMTWICGPIERVACQAARRAVPIDIEDTTSALFRFTNHTTGYLVTHFACPLTFHFHVAGTRANLWAHNDFAEVTVQTAADRFEPFSLTPVDTVAAELAAFAEACEQRAAFPVTPGQAIHNVAVMEAMAYSAKNGAGWTDVGRAA
jgi:predicted dehydrogenase